MCFGRSDNTLIVDHHTQVDHFEIIASQDDTDNIFSYIMNVPLSCGNDYFLASHIPSSSLVMLFNFRLQDRHGYFHGLS